MHCIGCGKKFTSSSAEAQHRHNFPSMCERNDQFRAFMATPEPPARTPEMRAQSYDQVPCPYCKKICRFEASDMPWKEEETKELDCQPCDKSFVIEAWPAISWTTRGVGQDG